MKAWLLLGAVVGCTVVADLLASRQMKNHGEVDDFRPGALGRLFKSMAQNKWLILSVFFMAISFFSFMTLMQTADLSFAVPASAASVAVETVLARVILKERVNWRRWMGAGLVAAGVYLLAV